MSATKRRKLEREEIGRVTIAKDQSDECLPIKSLEELKNWKPLTVSHITDSLQERGPDSNHPKTLICHDMKGGYLDDRFINGTNIEDNYYFLHWAAVDIFVYFSHHFVTIPPCSWISAAHRNGVKILGTFITEWEDGVKICDEVFKDEDAVQHLCTQLVKLADHHNFDGWLINIENKLLACQIPLLEKFVKILTAKMHSCRLGSLIIWYDSVLENGDLKWQNTLNEHNRIFFNSCDGIFLNYNWTEETLQQSANDAGERKYDVFVGVDVFGRGCPGGGGFSTDIAVTAARKFDLSVAIFAPGWLHECLDVKDFKENQFKFWDALQNLCPPRAIKSLPYFSSFCPGFGKKMFKNGKVISDEPWFNVSLQQPQPIYFSHRSSDEAKVSIYDEAFNGGGCLCLSGNTNTEANIKFPSLQLTKILSFKLLKTSFLLEEISNVRYVFKPLSPNMDVSLVFHVDTGLHPNYDLHLVGKKFSGSDSSSYILPASEEEEIERNQNKMDECSTMKQNWIKRSYVLETSNFTNHIIENISIRVAGMQNEASCVLLGEIKILPFHPRINFKYTDLVCSNREKINIQCTLQWSYHPSIYCSDLFLLAEDKKIYICRTSQFYYNLKLTVEKTSVLEILLSPQSSRYDCFPTKSLKIPVSLS